MLERKGKERSGSSHIGDRSSHKREDKLQEAALLCAACSMGEKQWILDIRTC